MTAAMTSHDGDSRTGTPATVPSRSGGAPARGRGRSARGCSPAEGTWASRGSPGHRTAAAGFCPRPDLPCPHDQHDDRRPPQTPVVRSAACRRRGPPTSSCARCCTGSGRSTGCRSAVVGRGPRHGRPPGAGAAVRRAGAAADARARPVAARPRAGRGHRRPAGRGRPVRRPAGTPPAGDAPRRSRRRWPRPRRRTAARPRVPTERWLAEAERLVGRWFELEDPTRLEPDGREVFVEHRVADDLVLRGIVDRVDVAPDGRIRVVDYKTGPGPERGVRAARPVPDEVLRAAAVAHPRPGAQPGAAGLRRRAGADAAAGHRRGPARGVRADRAPAVAGDPDRGRDRRLAPQPGRGCRWCDHQALCPALGGTPPPLPDGRRGPGAPPVEPEVPGDDEG